MRSGCAPYRLTPGTGDVALTVLQSMPVDHVLMESCPPKGRRCLPSCRLQMGLDTSGELTGPVADTMNEAVNTVIDIVNK